MNQKDNIEINSHKFFRNTPYQLPLNVLPPILIAWDLSTPENYGNLLRLADTIGFSKVIFVSNKMNINMKKIEKIAGHSFKSMPFEFVATENVWEKIPGTYRFVAIETASNSTNLYKTKLPTNVAFIVGNEKRGMPTTVLEKCYQIAHIPLTGNCTSLNVSHAATVVIFEWLRQVSF